MKHWKKGLVWLVIAVIFGLVITEWAMVWMEYKRYQRERYTTDDGRTHAYTCAIGIGTAIHWAIIITLL